MTTDFGFLTKYCSNYLENRYHFPSENLFNKLDLPNITEITTFKCLDNSSVLLNMREEISVDQLREALVEGRENYFKISFIRFLSQHPTV